jgi:hypothetical protein
VQIGAMQGGSMAGSFMQGGATPVDGVNSPFSVASSGADALGSRGFNQFVDQLQPSDTQPLKFLEPNVDPFSGQGGGQMPSGGPSSPAKPLVFA